MKVVYLAAGAANMYCGSCLRDNRLAATLRALGRDVTLVPLYTPIRTDEIDASEPTVYYGGLNVFLEQKSALFRHLPRFAIRWLDSPRLLRGVGRMAAGANAADLGALTVSVLRGEHGHQRAELDRLVDGLRGLRPDVINLPNAMFVGVARRLREALDVPVLCTLSGEDLFLDRVPEPQRAESLELVRAGAEHVDGFLSVTRYYAQRCVDFLGLPAERIRYVPMGISLPGIEDAPLAERPFVIGYLARISPEKGLLELAHAFVRLRDAGRDCRLRVAGYLGAAERSYFDSVHDLIVEQGHAHAFEHLGELDHAGKIEFLRSLHAFSMPSTYPEAKGLPVLEAMSCGVPVVAPRKGSFVELIEDTGGGLLYDPNDEHGLAAGLARLMDDPAQRERLGRDGRAAVHELHTDTRMAEQTWQVYEDAVRAPRRSSDEQ